MKSKSRITHHASRILLFLAVLILFYPCSSSAQPENKIRDTIKDLTETHLLRIGIFRIQPRFTIGSAYDSNAYSTEDSKISDYYGSIAPGASLAVRFAHTAYFVFQEDLNFVFYREQNQLNDVFDTTAGRFGIGSRRFLFEVTGSYVNNKTRIDEEFDQPAQQSLTKVDPKLTFALRKRTDIHFLFRQHTFLYELDEQIPTSLPIPPDTRTREYGAGFDELIGNRMRFAFGISTGQIRFLDFDLPEPESNFWKTLMGLEFMGDRLAGRAKLGYSEIDSTKVNQQSFQDLIIDTDVGYQLGKKLSVGGLLKRWRTVSSLSLSNFRLTTEGGVRGCVPLNRSRELFVDGTWIFGKNDYDDPAITKDTFHRLESGLNFAFSRDLVFRFGTTYQNRDSNLPRLTKDRFTFNIGLALETRRTRVIGATESCTPVTLYE